MYKKALLILIIALLVSFVGCMPSQEKPGTSNDINNTEAPTITPEAQYTEGPTNTIPVKVTPPITDTPSPTASPSPTPTPTPVPTPTPEPTPKPITDLVFSHESGYYAKGFNLVIQAPKGANIYYTLDNSTPTASSTKYNQAISINDISSSQSKYDGITVVRAVAYSGNIKIGSVKTMTYIVNQRYSSFVKRYNNMPVFSISTDADNLYDSQIGLFYGSNYLGRGREWERPVNLTYFTADGKLAFSQDAGMRIFGGTSRGHIVKSMRFIARKEYDPENGKFKYPLFDTKFNVNGEVIDRYEAILLRAGGNDNLLGGSHTTYLRDGIVQHLAGSVQPLDFTEFQPAVVYINGKYWGILNMRDTYDKDFVAQRYKVDAEKVAIASYGHRDGQWGYRLHDGPDGYEITFQNDLIYIRNNDMTSAANYREAGKLIDIDSFINYMAVNIYANNRDWPHNNVRAWKFIDQSSGKYSEYGKWRFMLRDIDYSTARYDWNSGGAESVMADETAHNRRLLTGSDGGDVGAAFGSLMRNSEFRDKFISVMCDLANDHFSATRFNNAITYFVTLMENEIPNHFSMVWALPPNYSSRSVPLTYSQWMDNITRLRAFANIRPDVMRNMLRDAYGLGSMVNLKIDVTNPNYGSVKLNTIDLTGTKSWQGKYFRNVDMSLTVLATPGKRVTSVTVTSGSATYNSTTGVLKITGTQEVKISIVFG